MDDRKKEPLTVRVRRFRRVIQQDDCKTIGKECQMGKVTPQIFDTVKTLLNSGVPVSQICDMLKLSNGVVY